MPELAAASAGEALFAETFAAAAPEMFAAPEILGAGEFGAGALGAAEGFGALGGLEGLGMAGLEGISGAAPSIAEAATQGIVSGGVGAGEAGINAAQVAAEQANAAEIANSGINQAAQQGMQGAERFADTTNASFPQTNPEAVQSAMNNPAAQPGAAMNAPYQSYDPVQAQLDQVPGGRLPPGMTGASAPVTESSGIMGGFNKAMDWIKENPLSAASMGMNALKLLDKKGGEAAPKEEYNGILSKYKYSPDFQGRQANPADYQYTPKVYGMVGGGITQAPPNNQIPFPNTQYPGAYISQDIYGSSAAQPTNQNIVDGSQTPLFAQGGIASYSKGGESALDYYERMTKQKENLPSGRSDPGAHYAGDVGIIFDTDPDTRSLDPVTAAQIRMAKVNKRANMQTPSMKRPTPMGQLNMVPVTMKGNPTAPDTVEAAHGGVIHSKRYADGGVTGSGNLDLHIPLDLGGGGGSGGSGGYGGGATYPFQNNGGFVGNNNAPQVAQQAAQNMPTANQPIRGLGAPQGNLFSGVVAEPQDVSSMKGTTFGDNPQQGMSQLGGLLGGLKMAGGGITSLGGYAAGGNPRLLKGPGDGMSDNIPATIAGKQPARLADGEFVIPADVVSHLGNGSTEAGAKKLHQMMTQVRKARTGNPKQGKQINPNKYMPK